MTDLKSEIVNRKKQFIFDVEAVKTHAFPNESILFYIYIKNISGTDIKNFMIKIQKDDDFFFKKDIPEEDEEITLSDTATKLYNMEGYCKKPGKYHIHFIAMGEGTQIAHKIITINCSRIYNSDKLMHRIHFYNFNPYESKYSLEASDFSNEVTQITKRQKLPYKTGEQPFPKIKVDKNLENTESESFLDQYKELYATKTNSDNHNYQYIGRETFIEDSLENYTGENLKDLINQINNNSEYFKATYLRGGTNTLLNDFTQYKPNGLIYRLGLLSSEIYHKLGVIPTFDYMSDTLFRWAPHPTGQHLFLSSENEDVENAFQLINLYPKNKAMKWDEHVWAGNGWTVYRRVTAEYRATKEFKRLLEKDKIIEVEDIGYFENKTEANDFIQENIKEDTIIKNQQRSDIIKYEYYLEEDLYSPGVFFVNIPFEKIPSNFVLPSEKDVISIINRAKPFGMKPIVNFVIEREFDATISQSFIPNYHKNFTFDIEEPEIRYRIAQNKIIEKTKECNGETITYLAEEPERWAIYDFHTEIEMEAKGEASFTIEEELDVPIEQEYKAYKTHPDQFFNTLEEIKELLYNNNYNNIAFCIKAIPYLSLKNNTNELIIDKNNSGERQINYITIENNEEAEKTRLFDSAKISVEKTDSTFYINVIDNLSRIHKFSAKYDQEEKLYKIIQSYETVSGKETIKKIGYQNIDGISLSLLEYSNRVILVFLVEDNNKNIHYFNHIIIQDIDRIEASRDILTTRSLNEQDLIFETPFCYSYESYTPDVVLGGDSWKDLYRINTLNKKYSSIENYSKDIISVDDIHLIYDSINLPETSIIKKAKFTIDGETRGKRNRIQIEKSMGNNYRIEKADGDIVQLRPSKLDCYPQKNESNYFYDIKLNTALLNDQKTLIDDYLSLIDENEIFDETINLNKNYLNTYDDYFSVSNSYWVEISKFTDNTYNLNNTDNISLVIEGYNTGKEITMVAQTSSETGNSSEVTELIPKGYFYKKVSLLYPNQFLLDLLRVRFRFKGLTNEIKIFNTALEINFKNKETDSYTYDYIDTIILDKQEKFNLLENYIYPTDINNGLEIKMMFNDLLSGDFYHINSINLEIIYQDTDVDMMINKSKYNYVPNDAPQLVIEGICTGYLSGVFYNDVASVCQIDSDINYKNKGAILKDTLFQSFEAKTNNITSIELFPQGFVGSPDENLKIGLYTNNKNSPGKLIKEIYANGWVKSNKELKDLNSIKYNLNVDNLNVGEKYWFKIQILNPKENSYYLLKDVEKSLPNHKLLFRENNNYINSFNTLTFNIYSQNLSRSFGNLPAVQEYFNNPYIIVGLHKGQGEIKNLLIDKWDSDISEERSMKEYFDSNIIQEFEIISEDSSGKKKKANLIINKWEDYNGNE